MKLAAKLLNGGANFVLGLCVVVVVGKPPVKLLLDGKLVLDWNVLTDGNAVLLGVPL